MTRYLLLVFAVVATLSGVGSQAQAQAAGTITGRVVDARTQEPLATVQVTIPALSRGVLTGADGRYSLTNVPAGVHNVRAQAIGFTTINSTVTLAAGGSAVMEFQLEQTALNLDAIVVTGTAGGTQRRAIGNVVERIDAESLVTLAPVGSVDQLLGARVPGLSTFGSNGGAGPGGQVIRIRGSSSLGVANDPIIFIDGIRMDGGSSSGSFTNTTSGATVRSSPLNDINPADIESVEVIKGPAAATLYGTEASNGVIQIITKKGASGAAAFDASVSLGTNWFPDPKGTIPDGYYTQNGVILSHNLYERESDFLGRDFFQKGPIRKYSLSARGGTGLIQYYASLNRDEEEGFVAWNTDERTNARTSLTVLPSTGLSISLNASTLQGANRSAGSNIWGTIVRQQPATIDNPLRRGFDTPPEAYSDGQNELTDVDRNTWSTEVRYEPVSWLRTRAVVGQDVNVIENAVITFREANAPSGFFGNNGLGAKTINRDRNQVTTADLSASAALEATPRLRLTTSSGLQYYKKVLNQTTLVGTEFATAALTTVGAAARTSAFERFVENATVGVYVQQQIDWDNRIFVTGAVRADDNSAFGSDFDIAVYPKLSATWVISDESFWAMPYFDLFRMRAAWGAAGQQPDAFAASQLYRPEVGTGNLPILTPSSFGNPDLGPERGEELEFGFDAEVFDGRISGEFTHYRRKTTDAIVAATLPPSLGFPGTQFSNIGLVKNWGSELAMGVQVLRGGRIGWDLGITAATMHNRIEDMGAVKRILLNTSAGLYHVEGYPMSSGWARMVVSADLLEGATALQNRATNILCDGGAGPNKERIGGEPVPCNEAPLLYYGRSGEPTWTVNLSSTLSVGDNVQLIVSTDGRGGNTGGSQEVCARLTTWGNSKPFHEATNPIYLAQRTVDRTPLCAWANGMLRLREVALNYNLPAMLVDRIGASRASVRVGARNLGYLWRETEQYGLLPRYELGERVIDPERRGLDNFGGHSHVQVPGMSEAVVDFRISF